MVLIQCVPKKSIHLAFHFCLKLETKMLRQNTSCFSYFELNRNVKCKPSFFANLPEICLHTIDIILRIEIYDSVIVNAKHAICHTILYMKP